MNRPELLVLAGSMSACALDTRQDAPDYTAKSLSGQTFTKASLKGSVVLVQTWATWCGYCRREQPIVDSLVDQFGASGLTFGAWDGSHLPGLRVGPNRPHSARSRRLWVFTGHIPSGGNGPRYLFIYL